MNNTKLVLEVQEFVQEMRDNGDCRTVTVRYTDAGMIVTLIRSEEGALPESYMFEWEDA